MNLPPHGSSLDTKPTLLKRLQSSEDPESWKEFYRVYGNLIRFFATKSGLTPEEAEEVVQETAIGVARKLPDFVYDPTKCRFKTWLLNLTRWRILDQIRKRMRFDSMASTQTQPLGPSPFPHHRSHDEETGTTQQIPDPNSIEFGREWDECWEKNLMEVALAKVRKKIEDLNFQIFDLNVLKGVPASEVAITLGISIPRVYLAKCRVTSLLKKEVRRLERAAEWNTKAKRG